MCLSVSLVIKFLIIIIVDMGENGKSNQSPMDESRQEKKECTEAWLTYQWRQACCRGDKLAHISFRNYKQSFPFLHFLFSLYRLFRRNSSSYQATNQNKKDAHTHAHMYAHTRIHYMFFKMTHRSVGLLFVRFPLAYVYCRACC